MARRRQTHSALAPAHLAACAALLLALHAATADAQLLGSRLGQSTAAAGTGGAAGAGGGLLRNGGLLSALANTTTTAANTTTTATAANTTTAAGAGRTGILGGGGILGSGGLLGGRASANGTAAATPAVTVTSCPVSAANVTADDFRPVAVACGALLGRAASVMLAKASGR